MNVLLGCLTVLAELIVLLTALLESINIFYVIVCSVVCQFPPLDIIPTNLCYSGQVVMS